MWNTRRILLLLCGFALYFSAYLVYFHFLGGIDGLPMLPAEFSPDTKRGEFKPLPRRVSDVDRKLQMAFGRGWEDLLDCSIKIEVASKNLVLAASDYEILPDGRVKLWPFNVAIFGKQKNPKAFPEINTVQSQVAYLTFDRPVSSVTDMGNRKIIAGELDKDIRIVNNRRTAQRDDDLSLFTPGPLYYQEDKNQIWTGASINLLDTQTRPEPTKITADGMEVHLLRDTDKKPNKPTKSKPTISGVKLVRLRSNVEMFMWIDARSGFLGKQAAANTGSRDERAPNKSRLVIKTQGPFVYDVTTDFGRFDIPEKPSWLGEKVTVTRTTEKAGIEQRDELVCHHLELQFHRKPGDSGRSEGSLNLAIEHAHATGQQVTLSSEAEGLHAIGDDFFYNAKTRESILKGNPEMVAMKDGHEIYARELKLVQSEKHQEARARGPGRIAMLDRASAKRTMHARWQDELVFTKDGEYDCLILTGNAVFEDKSAKAASDGAGQELRADRLKVWLEQTKGKADDDSQSTSGRLRPYHLEADGNVTARSPELLVQAPTDHLDIWFRDAPPPSGREPQPSSLPPAAANPPAAGSISPPAPGPSVLPPQADRNHGNAQHALAGEKKKSKKPLRISARLIESYVIRFGNKNELDRLRCQGNVIVTQEPEKSHDRGIEIRGDSLQLDHDKEGSFLIVIGDLAKVQLNRIAIYGPEVNIDQKNNKAWVDGIGAMEMITQNSLNGDRLEKPTELTIHWNKRMFFNGQYAIFHGGVQAEQENGRLLCQELQAFLDQPVSFKEGQKKGQSAKVRDLVCDKSVRIEDSTIRDGKLLRYTRLTAPEVSLNNEDGKMNAPGPGIVHILQLAPADALPQPAGNSRSGKEILKLTRVNYLGRLYADNKKRTATFYGNVEVFHTPSDDPDIQIDPDAPPPGSFFLTCKQLKVFSHKHANGQTSQEMEAKYQVFAEAQEFSARADVLKYDESKELIVFEGGTAGMATLYRTKTPGAPREKFTGKKIFYWRKTGEVKLEGGQVIGVGQ
ncbi:MAG: hypothetical protein KatS3mg105_0386 [Gemmatales bacterium]|nr:MAG: hypothetical protein KatS3mg105_0386 [Gemmatales bacterium]